MPDELAALDAELDRAERRIDPGVAGLLLPAGTLGLIVALVLPWTGSVQGWEVLAGPAQLGLLPPLFAGTSLGFGLACSALALATRWWALAWLAAVGSGFSVLAGVWAIWSRQVDVPAGATGPGIGMVLAVVAVLLLAVSWVRIATHR